MEDRIRLKPEACNFIKKEPLAQVFSCEILKNTFFYENLRFSNKLKLSWNFIMFRFVAKNLLQTLDQVES